MVFLRGGVLAMILPVYSLVMLKAILDRSADPYPFYSVLLYTPGNGLNARLQEYVRSHWSILNGLTGNNCLLLTIEDIQVDLSIEKFKPEDVYDIARYLGASVDNVPGMIFFTEPHASRKTEILKLSEFFSDSGSLTDEDLTDFFKSMQTIIDDCCNSVKTAGQRLECLHRGVDKKWPLQSRWTGIANKAQELVKPSFSTATTVALAVDQIYTVLQHLRLI